MLTKSSDRGNPVNALPYSQQKACVRYPLFSESCKWRRRLGHLVQQTSPQGFLSASMIVGKSVCFKKDHGKRPKQTRDGKHQLWGPSMFNQKTSPPRKLDQHGPKVDQHGPSSPVKWRQTTPGMVKTHSALHPSPPAARKIKQNRHGPP